MRIIDHDNPCFATAKSMQGLEHALTVVERAEGVDDENDVEWSRQ